MLLFVLPFLLWHLYLAKHGIFTKHHLFVLGIPSDGKTCALNVAKLSSLQPMNSELGPFCGFLDDVRTRATPA